MPQQEAKALCREIVGFLKLLKKTRDMSVNECKLIIAIEDPRATERRNVGIEVSFVWVQAKVMLPVMGCCLCRS